jgi:hypothetical protein
LAGFASAIDAENGIASERAPNETQRAWMERRALELEAALRPCPERELSAELSALFAVVAMAGGDDRDAAVLAAIYKLDMAEFPFFAVRSACVWWRRNEKWAPKIFELRAKADSFRRPFAEELAKIRRVLTARIGPPPETDADARKAVVERLRPMIDRIDAKPAQQAPERTETHDEAVARLAVEYAARPASLSREALHPRFES